MRVIAGVLLSSVVIVVAPAQPLQSNSARDESLYEIQDHVLIKTRSGATLSAIVVKRKSDVGRLPALLSFDIYTDIAAFRARCEEAADHGYVGVIADARGKRLSPDEIVPYEHEGEDAYEVIDWIAHQSWSDGQVGMRGASYSGFTAWAATKRLHPALKTIAVSAASLPGLGLPMYNNVFLSANYGWGFYVSNNRFLDEKVYGDRDRWAQLPEKWFIGGRPYREIDQVDGTPNPLLQRWLRHPAYDAYWQNMVPYGSDFTHIGIPTLTITGYYDDGEISALTYVKQLERFNRQARDYVVIGPYEHFGTRDAKKAEVVRGYPIDSVAQFSTPELVYQWMDYVMRGGKKPDLLESKINYEVMGANVWRHASSIAEMGNARVSYYFTASKVGDYHRLTLSEPGNPGAIDQVVDLANRTIQTNDHSYPDPIIEDVPKDLTELVFVSDPLPASKDLSGAFEGMLDVTINKRDFDAGVTVFEQMPDGKLFHLAYWLGRASYSQDSSKRSLLSPGVAARIPFQTPIISRRLSKGSRLLVLLDVNKNAIAQVNCGTDKDVSDEAIGDCKQPLRVSYHTDSYLSVPWETSNIQ